MDDIEGEDFDTIVRLKICDIVSEMADRGCKGLDTPDQFVTACETLEHYITNGGTVGFACDPKLTRTVRGGI